MKIEFINSKMRQKKTFKSKDKKSEVKMDKRT